MWSMINALQIVLKTPLIDTIMPSNVYTITSTLDSLDSFNILPA